MSRITIYNNNILLLWSNLTLGNESIVQQGCSILSLDDWCWKSLTSLTGSLFDMYHSSRTCLRIKDFFQERGGRAMLCD